jgi:hypothetical protein
MFHVNKQISDWWIFVLRRRELALPQFDSSGSEQSPKAWFTGSPSSVCSRDIAPQ